MFDARVSCSGGAVIGSLYGLIGMGVVASGLAWLVERLARATAGPALERGLASRLAPLAWPTGGLVPETGDDPLAVLERPGPPR